MKKQILFITLVTLAFIFAGTKSYGQDANYINVGSPTCPVPALLNCGSGTAGHLNPIPGVVYDYEVSVSPGVTAAGGGYIQWFVTDVTTTLVNGAGPVAGIMEPNDGTSDYLLAATPAAAYNSTTNTSSTISISWQSFDAAIPVLLVAYVKGENGCSDNIEVWRIQPTFTFRLEIAGINPDGTVSATANECVTPVQSAIYNGTNLTMDYGDNYVFFIVSAASFVDSWQPTFVVASSSTPVALATDVQWAYPAQAILAAGTWNAITVPVEAQNALNAVGDGGECIIVRVHVDHNAVENDVASTVTLTVDGIMFDASATLPANAYTNPLLADLDNGAAPGDPCVVGSNDVEIFTLNPRPNITEVTPGAGTFEPKN